MICKRCLIDLDPIHSKIVRGKTYNDIFCSDYCKDEYYDIQKQYERMSEDENYF